MSDPALHTSPANAAHPHFESARVLVVGDAMLDRYWHGDAGRISPEAPVPVVRVRRVEARPGGAANVAVNVAALGAVATLVALIGEDEPGATLARALDEAGVRGAFIRSPAAPTVCKLRVLAHHQQLIRLDVEEHWPVGPHHEQLLERVQALIADHDIVVLSDYAKGTLADVGALIGCAVAAGRPVLVDPKARDLGRYRGATGLTPNLAELEAAAGPCSDATGLESGAREVLAELGLEWLLVTRGEDGMSLVQDGHDTVHSSTRAREVYDVTGAGDTVIAVMATALAAGESTERAAFWANLAAGLVVSKLGTAAVTGAELWQAHAEAGDAAVTGHITEAQALEQVRVARARGERVVVSNGCFDILHAGHVRCLEQARGYGDRLLVAVNDDASVRRLKGSTRPVNALAERAAVLAGLRAVDWVVGFAEDTPERLIEQLCPDVLVKGGDYAPEDIAGARFVLARGGRVETVALVPGCSTTGMLAALTRATEESA